MQKKTLIIVKCSRVSRPELLNMKIVEACKPEKQKERINFQ